MSLREFLDKELKEIISEKYGIPLDEMTEEVYRVKLQELKKWQDENLPLSKGCVCGYI